MMNSGEQGSRRRYMYQIGIDDLFFFLMIRRPPRSTPFPHTPLFRSEHRLPVTESAAVLSTAADSVTGRRCSDRKSGVWGKGVDLGGRRIIKKKKRKTYVSIAWTDAAGSGTRDEVCG